MNINLSVGPLVALLAGILILNEAYVTSVGDTELGLKPMGTGPYMLREWVKEDHLTLEAFPDYFGGKAKIDTVIFRPITNPATRTAALLTGELDVVQDLAVRDVDRVKSEPGITVLTRPSLLNILLAMDVREKSPTIALDKNPMTDRRVREAIARAIDVDTIDKVIMAGLATPSTVTAKVWLSLVYMLVRSGRIWMAMTWTPACPGALAVRAALPASQ